MDLRKDSKEIIQYTIENALPDKAVLKALEQLEPAKGDTYLIAIGKAAWQMAKAASEVWSDYIKRGIVITKYDHGKGALPNIDIFEAGHPVPDENSFLATQKVIELTNDLQEEDQVLFLVSGGGSALFEKSLLDARELEGITKSLLACGADIVEMNTIRKRLSVVKGGKFAKLCEPAKIKAIILSDIIGDPLDMIASGPAYKDSSTAAQARAIVDKYNLNLLDKTMELLSIETPKQLNNVESYVMGSVKELCKSASEKAEELGYRTLLLTDCITAEAKEVGNFLAAIAKTYSTTKEPVAFILGGETVVHLNGSGMGGRNQEIALSAAKGIKGLSNVAVFSVGSDGTDGPTDAAGGYCDGNTVSILEEKGISIEKELNNNNAYCALSACDGLIITGATGTNVNDFTVLLIRPQ